MTKRVEMELQKLANEYKGRGFEMEIWERIINRSGISFATFKKYVKLEKIECYEEKTLEEIVGALNACSGEDCYGAEWEYKVIQGKPYQVWTEYVWE